MARIVLIVALAKNRVIGRQGTLPWHLPDDLKLFKALTLGKPVVMGRKTYESIGKPLPGRRNVVVSGQADLTIPGCEVVGSLDHALDLLADAAEVCIIGGATLYQAALPIADRLELTRIDANVDGDVRLPPIDESAFFEAARAHHPSDERHAYAFDFVTLDRRPS